MKASIARRTVTALAAAGLLGAAALAAAPASSAADGTTSLASVLKAGQAKFDKDYTDYDIVTKAVETVLKAKPDSAVKVLADGTTALRALESGAAFDIVISDQTMPGMTGVAFAQAVHERQPRLPIVLYTGRADALAAADLDRAGVRALLSKPIDAQALIAILRMYLPAAATGTGR